MMKVKEEELPLTGKKKPCRWGLKKRLRRKHARLAEELVNEAPPTEKMKKTYKASAKSGSTRREGSVKASRPNGATNTGGPTGNQSQNAPFQQAPAVNSGGGGGGMTGRAAGFGGGQGGGYGGGGGPQFGNGNPNQKYPMNGLGNNESLVLQGNRQFNEQSVSEVMQAMQVLANHRILRLDFGFVVAAMAQMRTGQESQMTANHGSAGFGDGYGGGGQGGGQGGPEGLQGDQSWRR